MSGEAPGGGFYRGSGRRYHASACHMIANAELASVSFIPAELAQRIYSPCRICAPLNPEPRNPALEYVADGATGERVQRGERVRQADPAVCVKVAREFVRDARLSLAADPPRVEDALAALDSAACWLPSWLEDEWSERMAAWIERANR